MIAAYKKFWLNYTNFTGRSSRSDYWFVYLFQLLITIPLSVIIGGSFISSLLAIAPYLNESGEAVGISEDVLATQLLSQILSPLNILIWIILMIYGLAAFIPSLSLTVRRLRDAGFHWAMIFISFIPYVGGLALIVMLALPTKEDPVVNAQVTAPEVVSSETPTVVVTSEATDTTEPTVSEEQVSEVTNSVATSSENLVSEHQSSELLTSTAITSETADVTTTEN